MFNVPSQEIILSSNSKELDIRAKIVALKPFLMNEIYELRQQLAQIAFKDKQEEKKDRSNNERCIKELGMKLQHFQKVNQILRNENLSKRIETMLN